MKKLFSVLALLAFAALAAPAYAATSNSNTGAGSDNDAHECIESEVEVRNHNEGNVSNSVDFKLNTGGNEVEKNTGGEEDEEEMGENRIETGNAEANVEIENKVNTNETKIGEEEEEEEGGQGGGEELPLTPPISEGAGLGGGAELAAAVTPETGAGFGGGTLAEVGQNQWIEMALLLGLPFVLLYFLRKYELKTGRIAA